MKIIGCISKPAFPAVLMKLPIVLFWLLPKYSNGNMCSCWKRSFVLVAPLLHVGGWKMDGQILVLWNQTFRILSSQHSELHHSKLHLKKTHGYKQNLICFTSGHLLSLTLHMSLPELAVQRQNMNLFCILWNISRRRWHKRGMNVIHCTSHSIASLFSSPLL